MNVSDSKLGDKIRVRSTLSTKEAESVSLMIDAPPIMKARWIGFAVGCVPLMQSRADRRLPASDAATLEATALHGHDK